MDFSVGSKPLRPDAECSISAIQASLEKVVFVNYSIYYSESKLSFCNKVRRFVKKCVSSVFLFGAYTLIRTTGFS